MKFSGQVPLCSAPAQAGGAPLILPCPAWHSCSLHPHPCRNQGKPAQPSSSPSPWLSCFLLAPSEVSCGPSATLESADENWILGLLRLAQLKSQALPIFLPHLQALAAVLMGRKEWMSGCSTCQHIVTHGAGQRCAEDFTSPQLS